MNVAQAKSVRIATVAGLPDNALNAARASSRAKMIKILTGLKEPVSRLLA